MHHLKTGPSPSPGPTAMGAAPGAAAVPPAGSEHGALRHTVLGGAEPRLSNKRSWWVFKCRLNE